LQHDPTEDVSSVRESKSFEGSGKVLTADELSRLLQAVEQFEPSWYPLIRLLATTGMRWSEATALKWSDIDLDAGHLTINRKHVGGIIGPPKTRASRRHLPLEPGTVEVLKAHRADLIRRQAPGLPDGWVFPSESGGLLFNGVAGKPLVRAARRAGLDKRPSAHWFRHTLNHLLGQAANERVQMAMLGDVTDTMRLHYDHVFLEEKRSAVVRAIGDLSVENPLIVEGEHPPAPIGENT
jgi:integrase